LGSAKAVAQELGVTADPENRYRRGARKHVRADVAATIDDAVRARQEPQVRKRRQRLHGFRLLKEGIETAELTGC